MTMKTDTRRLTIYAVIIIILIISAGIASLILQEKVTRFEAVSATGASADSLWIIEGERVMRYSDKGTFLSEFVFNTSFSDVFPHKEMLLFFHDKDRSVQRFDTFGRFQSKFFVGEAAAVYYDNGIITAIYSSAKKIVLYSMDGTILSSHDLEYEPSGVMYFNNDFWYSPYAKNKFISIKTKKELSLKDFPAGFSILRGYESNGVLYFIAAQRKGGSYYYARFFMYSIHDAKLRQSVKRYIHPITITKGHKKIYIGSNLENAIDIYSFDGDYKGRFGDDSFIKKHSKMYMDRSRYVVIVMVMNGVVIVSFFLSLYVFILSNRLKKKALTHAQK